MFLRYGSSVWPDLPTFSDKGQNVNTTTSAIMEATGLKKTAEVLPLQRKGK